MDSRITIVIEGQYDRRLVGVGNEAPDSPLVSEYLLELVDFALQHIDKRVHVWEGGERRQVVLPSGKM